MPLTASTYTLLPVGLPIKILEGDILAEDVLLLTAMKIGVAAVTVPFVVGVDEIAGTDAYAAVVTAVLAISKLFVTVAPDVLKIVVLKPTTVESEGALVNNLILILFDPERVVMPPKVRRVCCSFGVFAAHFCQRQASRGDLRLYV